MRKTAFVLGLVAVAAVGCKIARGPDGHGRSMITWKGQGPEVSEAQIKIWPEPPEVKLDEAQAIATAGGRTLSIPGSGTATLKWAFLTSCYRLAKDAAGVEDNMFLRCPRFDGLTEVASMRYPFWVIRHQGNFGPCPTGPGTAVRRTSYVDAATGRKLASVPLCGDPAVLGD